MRPFSSCITRMLRLLAALLTLLLLQLAPAAALEPSSPILTVDTTAGKWCCCFNLIARLRAGWPGRVVDRSMDAVQGHF